MPRIASVAMCVVVVPLEKVTSFSTRTVRERHYGLVKIRSAEGIEGVGYSYAGNRAGHLLAITIADLLAPKLVGEDSLRVEGLWEDLYQEAILQGRAGVVMRGLSALDMALWDLNARSAGLPLYRYLGAFEWDSVPAYASGGYYLDGKTPRLLGKEMEGFAKQGYAAVKMKVGRLSPAEEERREAQDAQGRRREDGSLQAVGRSLPQHPPRRPRRLREVIGHRIQRALDAHGRPQRTQAAELLAGQAEVAHGPPRSPALIRRSHPRTVQCGRIVWHGDLASSC